MNCGGSTAGSGSSAVVYGGTMAHLKKAEHSFCNRAWNILKL